MTDLKNSDSTSSDTPKNKRQSQQKQCQQPAVNPDDNNKTIHRSTSRVNNYLKYKSRQSRSSSRATRFDYIDHQDLDCEISAGRNASREYIQSPKKYYLENHRYNNYSQDQPFHGSRSNSKVQHRDSSRSIPIQQKRYSTSQSRYFNGPMVRHNSFNGPTSRHNSFTGSTSHHGGSNNQHNNDIRHNSYSNESMAHQSGYYGEVINNHRNNFFKGSVRQEGYTNSRVFRPPRFVNGMASKSVDGVIILLI